MVLLPFVAMVLLHILQIKLVCSTSSLRYPNHCQTLDPVLFLFWNNWSASSITVSELNTYKHALVLHFFHALQALSLFPPDTKKHMSHLYTSHTLSQERMAGQVCAWCIYEFFFFLCLWEGESHRREQEKRNAKASLVPAAWKNYATLCIWCSQYSHLLHPT